MRTIFIGGSRDITRLPPELQHRLDTVINQGHRVILGDANGADKAVQKYLADRHYRNVTLFCSGDRPRNNLGHWSIRNIEAPGKTKDYLFFAAKDREMAREADFGLMIWDGKSPGTLLNLVRLSKEDKIAVLYHLPRKDVMNFKTGDQLREFISSCDSGVRADIEKRATKEEKSFLKSEHIQPSLEGLQPSLIDHEPQASNDPANTVDQESITALNDALHDGNIHLLIEVLGSLARSKGMTQVARETGLAREGLYRSLSQGGNPEFATVMKVLSSIGITLEARPPKGDAPGR